MLLLLVLFVAVATTAVSDAIVTGFTPGGLYIVYRNETPPYSVTVRQVGIDMSDPDTVGTFSEWSIPLGPSDPQAIITEFGTIDMKSHILISKYRVNDFTLYSGEAACCGSH